MPEPVDLQAVKLRRAEKHALVPCARCGRDIPMHSTRCQYCGVHFDGQAFQFTYDGAPEPTRGQGPGRLFRLGVVLAIAAFFLYMLISRFGP